MVQLLGPIEMIELCLSLKKNQTGTPAPLDLVLIFILKVFYLSYQSRNQIFMLGDFFTSFYMHKRGLKMNIGCI